MKKLLFLAFLSIFGLLLSNNCFALQHDYNALFTSNIFHPDMLYDSSSGAYYNDNSQYDPYSTSTGLSSPIDNDLSWYFPSDYNFLNTQPFTSVGYSLNDSITLSNRLSYTDSACSILLSGDNYYIHRNLILDNSSKVVRYRTRAFTYNSWSGVNPCYKINNGFSYNFQSSLFDTWNVHDWSSTYTLPYSPTDLSGLLSDRGVNGLRLTDSAITHSGITYSGSFSPSRLIQNNNMLGFKIMSVPLFTSDGYFMSSDNLYRGRQLEWRFHFNFNGDVILRNDSGIKISGRAYYRFRPDQYTLYKDLTIGCTSEYIRSVLDGETDVALEISCPVSLDSDYISFYPHLIFQSGGDYSFFEEYTPNEWSFSSALLISDNNTEPGLPFNDDLTGGDWNIFNGSDYQASIDPDWLTSLKNLFNFSLSNTPLGLIFGSFNNDNCANIPIIAGMIHSEESQVCPWFSAETRAITTPVLALFSGFLIFGFFMRWLGSSSGNFVEDSSTHESGNFTIKKRGK